MRLTSVQQARKPLSLQTGPPARQPASQEGSKPFIRAAHVRAYDDRAHAFFVVRSSYVAGLCPVVMCPSLCPSDFKTPCRHVWPETLLHGASLGSGDALRHGGGIQEGD